MNVNHYPPSLVKKIQKNMDKAIVSALSPAITHRGYIIRPNESGRSLSSRSHDYTARLKDNDEAPEEFFGQSVKAVKYKIDFEVDY